MSSRWNQNSSPFNEDVNSSDPTISFKALLSLEQEIQQNITLIKNEEPPKISYSERQSLVSKTEKLLTESYTKTKEWKKKANQRTYEKMRDEILQQVRHHILEINNLKNLLRRAVLKMRLDQVEEYEVKRRQMLCSDGHTDEVPSPFAPRKSVSYGQEIIGELDNQGHEIDATIQELREIQGTVSKGRNWISFLRCREFLDKISIYLSFSFFILTCLYIIMTRIRLTALIPWPSILAM